MDKVFALMFLIMTLTFMFEFLKLRIQLKKLYKKSEESKNLTNELRHQVELLNRELREYRRERTMNTISTQSPPMSAELHREWLYRMLETQSMNDMTQQLAREHTEQINMSEERRRQREAEEKIQKEIDKKIEEKLRKEKDKKVSKYKFINKDKE